TDANGCTGLQAYTKIINASVCPTITIMPQSLPQGAVDVVYNQSMTASGGQAPYIFSLNGDIITDGLLFGTPTTAGTVTFTITATDANGCIGLRDYTVVINAPVCPPITLAPPLLPQGTEGVAYSRSITASGGQAPYTFSVTAGTLPNGLLFTNGLISGTPTTAGTFTFTVTATDANGCTGLQAYTITIAKVLVPLNVPTLSEWGMIIFMTLMGLLSIYYLRRQED
ncbi:MAG: IPTL-CTERM sorting domain-containing protein, partial [Desulfamplus sp.]|nr:IPTL-CTERM sorting domain-containing protein [Desulfamplus sp.]